MSEALAGDSIDRIVAALLEGKSLRTACEEAEVPPGEFLRRTARSRRLQKKLALAQRTAIAMVEDALYETALKGNATALALYLCNRVPERWRPTSATKAETPRTSECVTPAELLERYHSEDQTDAAAVRTGSKPRVA